MSVESIAAVLVVWVLGSVPLGMLVGRSLRDRSREYGAAERFAAAELWVVEDERAAA